MKKNIRKQKRVVKIGNVKIGGGHPVAIQSMLKVKTSDTDKAIKQIGALEKEGCELIRFSVKDEGDIGAIKTLKRSSHVPLIADIHFNYSYALKAIDRGVDKIRINPGNITKKNEINEIISCAKQNKVPIRLGINTGSIPEKLRKQKKSDRLNNIVKYTLDYLKLFEAKKFHDIIISLKFSDVISTIEAYRKVSDLTDYPLHVGVTAAGPCEQSVVKSSIAIGSLLTDGIGDTIRVSITGSPLEEVHIAKSILQASGVRTFCPDIISCPTCGRCQVNLIKMVKAIQRDIRHTTDEIKNKRFKIALMGCEVNGPGEAKDADIGVAFGKNSGLIFKRGKVVRKISGKNLLSKFIKVIKDEME